MTLKNWIIALILAYACPVGAASAGQPERLAPGQVLRGQFVQERIMEGFSAPLRTTGDFVLASGQGLIWQAKEPFAVTTVMSAKGISQQNGSSQILNLPSSRAPFLARLYDILGAALAGDPRMLEQHFEVTQTEGPDGWHLMLTPRSQAADKGMPVREIEIAGRRFVEHVVVHKVGEDRDQLTFVGQSLDKGPLSAAEVELLAHVGEQ